MVASCTHSVPEPLSVDFRSRATKRVSHDRHGHYEEYQLKQTRVRFYEENTPESIKTWQGYGTDGGRPSTFLKMVKIILPVGEYSIPPELVTDMGAPNLMESGKFDYVRLRQEKRLLTIAMLNSDGAGGYKALYLIDLDKLEVKRFVEDYLELKFSRTHDWTPLDRVGGRTDGAIRSTSF